MKNEKDIHAINEAYNIVREMHYYDELIPYDLPSDIDDYIEFTLVGGDNEELIFSVGYYKPQGLANGVGFIQTDEGPEGFKLHNSLLDHENESVDLDKIREIAVQTDIGYIDDDDELVSADITTSPEFADDMQKFLYAMVNGPASFN